jgi:hypothetical protein
VRLFVTQHAQGQPAHQSMVSSVWRQVRGQQQLCGCRRSEQLLHSFACSLEVQASTRHRGTHYLYQTGVNAAAVCCWYFDRFHSVH